MAGSVVPDEVTLETRASVIAGRGSFAVDGVPGGTAVHRFADVPATPDALGPFNHSCDPTLGWDGSELVTLRDLTTDDELTVDYATFVADPAFVLWCHCETYRCRQVVEGTDWQIPQLQQRYAGHWSPEVQRLIESTPG